MELNTIYIDDRDTRVSYSDNSGWRESGDKEEFGSTTHGAGGDQNARAILTFTGTSVVVFGTVAKNTEGRSAYDIDGSMLNTFTNPISSSTMYQQIFFESGRLENKQHMLTIMPSFVGSGTFWLDYFKVTEVPVWLASNITFHVSQSIPAPPGSTTSMTGLTEPTANNTSPSVIIHSSTGVEPTQSLTAPTKTSSIPTMGGISTKAIIAGPIMGGAIVLSVIAFFVWRSYKRKKASYLLPTPMIIPNEPSRMGNASVHGARSFHKSRIVTTRLSRPPQPNVARRDTRSHAPLEETLPAYSENGRLLV
ncbi:hypothetical protein BDZ94DRAFT_1246057 [Collybia nuda]|uniref:Uncharacterized protein n=1 Tax=Collybia nuda TaxID=64659 RepID=A0A9P5YGU7_9AGAR|nr:hypothetical protein BDZ94DRAFT_1246057 [Collybia nuda]